MTRGAEGAVGFSSGGRVRVAPVVVDAVDTVGAGDTFSAGILDALAARGLLGAAQREELHAMPADDVRSEERRVGKERKAPEARGWENGRDARAAARGRHG